MPKPPETPPSSDIDGVHKDRIDRCSSKTFDGEAQAQMDAERKENVGHPERGAAVPSKRDN